MSAFGQVLTVTVASGVDRFSANPVTRISVRHYTANDRFWKLQRLDDPKVTRRRTLNVGRQEETSWNAPRKCGTLTNGAQSGYL